MSEPLCVNCGKPRKQHIGVIYGFCHEWPEPAVWRDPTEIEQRTAEAIATWLESTNVDSNVGVAAWIRSGAWKVKP